MIKESLRIGISMRITDAVGYIEKRDSIAQDWSRFCKSVLPEIQWLYIPNIGEQVTDYVTDWKLNAFILTGGENIGTSNLRDTTELSLLDYALENNFPVLGVCRGLQIIYHKLGGLIESQDSNFAIIHRAKRHSITINGETKIVNSYHDNKLIRNTLPGKLNILATCLADASIEAVAGENLLGIMWHPERELEHQEWDAKMISEFLHKNG